MPEKLITTAEIDAFVQSHRQWTHENNAIRREFRFLNFTQAMNFVNGVAQGAESANHHPDIEIHYNLVILTISTHDSGGITRKDIDLAIAAEVAGTTSM